MADKEKEPDKDQDKTRLNGGRIPISFMLGDRLIDGASVNNLPFTRFVEFIAEAMNMKSPMTFEGRMKRVRLARQVSYHSNGSIVPIELTDVLQLSINDAIKLTRQLDAYEDKAGKIIRAGDGIEKAICYELGKPIPVGAGKPPITELEFLAKTYGEVEDVLAAWDAMTQTSLLISTVAKPVHTSLQALPSWAVDQITIADGVTISREVLPHFLGQDSA